MGRVGFVTKGYDTRQVSQTMVTQHLGANSVLTVNRGVPLCHGVIRFGTDLAVAFAKKIPWLTVE
jgi:hypothetical protein